MRKNFIYKIVGLALLIVSIVSCETADQDVSPIVSPDDSYPVVTFITDFTGSTVAEGDTIVYSVFINRPIDRALTFSASIIGGDADDSDIEVLSGTIDPYSTDTVEVSVVFVKDWPAEDDETAEIEIGLFSLADKYLVQPSTVNPVLNLTIDNYISDTLWMEFGWDSEIFVNAGYEDFPDYGWVKSTSGVDYDVFVADAEGFDINDPWATINWMAYAATGDNPEEMFFAGVPDGSYILFCELWYNPFVDPDEYPEPQVVEHKPMPIISTFRKQGIFEVVYEQDASQVINSVTPGPANAAFVGDEIIDTFLAKVTVAGNQYTIVDFGDADMGGGKGVKTRTPRPASLIKK